MSSPFYGKLLYNLTLIPGFLVEESADSQPQTGTNAGTDARIVQRSTECRADSRPDSHPDADPHTRIVALVH